MHAIDSAQKENKYLNSSKNSQYLYGEKWGQWQTDPREKSTEWTKKAFNGIYAKRTVLH